MYARRMLPLRSIGLCALATALLSACIPPELTAGEGGGAGTGNGGAGATTSAGGTTSGGSGGTTTTAPLCTADACIAAGGECITGVCVIPCAAPMDCPTTVMCPKGMPCRVECSGASSCALGVDCSLATACDVVCTGPSSCGSDAVAAQVKCSPGSCGLDCGNETCPRVALDCAAGVCTVDCAAGACDDVTCQGECQIQCGGEGACQFVGCSGGACNIACNSTGTCAVLACGDSGPCAITCEGAMSCANVDCTAACACAVTCNGQGSCAGAGAYCPQDDMGGLGPCSDGAGCTDLGTCTTCP